MPCAGTNGVDNFCGVHDARTCFEVNDPVLTTHTVNAIRCGLHFTNDDDPGGGMPRQMMALKTGRYLSNCACSPLP